MSHIFVAELICTRSRVFFTLVILRMHDTAMGRTSPRNSRRGPFIEEHVNLERDVCLAPVLGMLQMCHECVGTVLGFSPQVNVAC